MDFTTRRERRGTAATKWEKYAGTDILPFWVADMEFETAEPILEALHRRVDQEVSTCDQMRSQSLGWGV